jgi:hypothetical protein
MTLADVYWKSYAAGNQPTITLQSENPPTLEPMHACAIANRISLKRLVHESRWHRR